MKKTITISASKEGETASKYHQSHAVAFTALGLGTSRAEEVEMKSEVMEPLTDVTFCMNEGVRGLKWWDGAAVTRRELARSERGTKDLDFMITMKSFRPNECADWYPTNQDERLYSIYIIHEMSFVPRKTPLRI